MAVKRVIAQLLNHQNYFKLQKSDLQTPHPRRLIGYWEKICPTSNILLLMILIYIIMQLVRQHRKYLGHQKSQTINKQTRMKLKNNLKELNYYSIRCQSGDLSQYGPYQQGICRKLQEKLQKFKQGNLLSLDHETNFQNRFYSHDFHSQQRIDQQNMIQKYCLNLIQGKNHITNCFQCLKQIDINNMVFQSQGDSIQVINHTLYKNQKQARNDAIHLICKTLNKKGGGLIIIGKRDDNQRLVLHDLYITKKDEDSVRAKFMGISKDIQIKFVPIFRKKKEKKLFLESISAVVICCHPSQYRQSGYCIYKGKQIIGVDNLMYQSQDLKDYWIPEEQGEDFLYRFMQKKMVGYIEKKKKPCRKIRHWEQNQLFQYEQKNYLYKKNGIIIQDNKKAEQIKKKVSLITKFKCEISQNQYGLTDKKILLLSYDSQQMLEHIFKHEIGFKEMLIATERGVTSKLLIQDSAHPSFQLCMSALRKDLQIKLQSDILQDPSRKLETKTELRFENQVHSIQALIYLREKGFKVSFG